MPPRGDYLIHRIVLTWMCWYHTDMQCYPNEFSIEPSQHNDVKFYPTDLKSLCQNCHGRLPPDPFRKSARGSCLTRQAAYRIPAV
jgi:hypothetical protein